MRISVIGTGYLGATHAACMASLGHTVIGVDSDPAKIDQLSAGKAPFFEPRLDPLLASETLTFSTSLADAASQANVHFIGVGTPQRRDGLAADTSAVEKVVEDLVPLLRGRHVIVGKSTVPVGTAAGLQQRADELAQDAQVEIVWNPEFLREGHAVADTLHPDRIVVGARPQAGWAVDLVREVYAASIEEGSPFLLMDLATAELVKASANAFLATKISFINAMAEVCEAAGADVTQLSRAIGMDERIGPKFLSAGLGFGGGCLPKDIRAFIARGEELGVSDALGFLREVDATNLRRRERVVEMVRHFGGTRVCVLGAAFKPESDDMRDSPALDVARKLAAEGFEVSVYDPKARPQDPNLHLAGNLEEALRGADVTVLATEWQEFRELDPEATGNLVARRVIVDGRNVLDPVTWRKAGWQVAALGRCLDEEPQREAEEH